MSDTPVSTGPCAPWVTLAEARANGGACACEDVTEELHTAMLVAASEALYLLSGRQWSGECEATVVPAGQCLGTPVIGRAGWLDWSRPGVRRYGWAGRSGCCNTRVGVDLGAVPIISVEEVVLNGEVVDPGEYHVEGARTLVRDEGWWPCCPERNGFEVSFTFGAMPPALGRQAVIDLACELALSRCSPEACGLNRRVQTVARQGVTIQLPGLIDALADGRTGIATVDLFLHSTNPHGLRRRGRVLSPDLHRPRRLATPIVQVGSDPYRAAPAPLPRARGRGRPPRLLADLHLYQPEHNAGAEVMVHAMLKAAQAAGWLVRVAARDVSRDQVFDGVDVLRASTDRDLLGHYSWCDVALTHLDTTRRAIAWARRGRRPLVHVVHNHRQLAVHAVKPQDAALVVWNSQWIADRLGPDWPGRSAVVRPPVFSADYATPRDRADAVTLVNLTEAKGGDLLWRLAELQPDRLFLAVRGSYGIQIVPKVVPPNVEVWDNGPDARAFYARTRVLLVPSSYESWGRVAVEALASDVPVLAHPTPGLIESMGPAATFLDRTDPAAWTRALRRLDDATYYRAASMAAACRSVELDDLSRADLDGFVAALGRLVQVPTSNLAVWPAILHLVQTAPHRSVLDVGPGFGKAGILLREYLNQPPARLDAIEAWEPYVTPRMRALYDEVIVGSVLDQPAAVLGAYELVLMVDVIEHLDKPAALALLDRIPGWVVVCTPRDFFSNGPGLPHTEDHVSHWSAADFGERVEYEALSVLDLGGVLVRLRPLG